MSRLVVVDDSNGAIEFTGTGWSAVTGSLPGTVLLDNAISQTGHILSSNGSLSLAFNGSTIEVFGVSSELHLSTKTKGPSWQCLIDNIVIPNNNNATRDFPWTSYCSHSDLNDSPHVLTMNINASQDATFSLDYIRYSPLPTDSLPGQTLLVNWTDSALQFTPPASWKQFGTAEVVSPNLSTPATCTITFNGTGLAWYALSPNSTRTASGDKFIGSYSATEGSALALLDGEFKTWAVPSTVAPPSSDQSYDFLILNYTSLDPSKEHTLVVTYNGSADLPPPPLSLDFLIIENDLTSGASNSSTGTSLPPGGSSPLDGVGKSKHNSNDTAAIVGGVLGGVLLLLLLILLIRHLLIRQRKARYRAKVNQATSNAVFHPDVDDDPFNDSDTYAMHESTLRNSDPVSGFSPPKREAFGSKFVEEMPTVNESTAAFSANRASSPVASQSFSHTDYQFPSASISVPQSTRTTMLINSPVPQAPRSWSSASPAPSSPANPFRRMTLASVNSPSIPPASIIASFESPSRETVSLPSQRSNTNPFRVNGGTLSPMSTGRL